jgi:hypothetical protein
MQWMIKQCYNYVKYCLANRMKWLMIAVILVFLYWLTSKDRSVSAMVESIAADFRSTEPSPFAVKEGFHGRWYGRMYYRSPRWYRM